MKIYKSFTVIFLVSLFFSLTVFAQTDERIQIQEVSLKKQQIQSSIETLREQRRILEDQVLALTNQLTREGVKSTNVVQKSLSEHIQVLQEARCWQTALPCGHRLLPPAGFSAR